MARNNIKLDTKGFDAILRELEKIGGNVRKATDDALRESAERIQMDTHVALNYSYLPARGYYSKGNTSAAVVDDATPRWEGDTAWVPVGFDFTKKGAGGWLITGTPRMRPDAMLNKMYKQKAYMRDIQNDMWKVVEEYVTGQRS